MFFDLPVAIEMVQFAEPPALFGVAVQWYTSPTEKDFQDCAEKINGAGFEGSMWSKFGQMVQFSLRYMHERYPFLSYKERKEAVVNVLYRVVDVSDTPCLPDNYFDPFFKEMVPPFVDLLMPDVSADLVVVMQPIAAPSAEERQKCVDHIISQFPEGFYWKDLAAAIRLSILHSFRFDLPIEGQREKAKQIIDDVIDQTDTAYLPDYFSDRVFKEISRSVIDECVQTQSLVRSQVSAL